MVSKINFVFTIHFHQPTGQLDWVNKRIYENSYKLLLEIMKKYADLKYTIHISGPLLLYLNENYPEWLDELAKLADYGTIEFLAGSIGEAVLPILPIEDRYNQVKEYISVFEDIMGHRPRGLWLPERVWEPSLPAVLAKNNIEYVLIDDSTLYRAGRSSEDAYYAWNTEEGGEIVKVFFIDTALRYILPWRSSEEVLDYMLSRGNEVGDRVIVWGSDAEKFGEWRDAEWARQWLSDFLEKLRDGNSGVNIVHPSDYLRGHGIKGLLYLPSGSYDKMLEWSNGFFRNFLIKYRESNNMHKKMYWVRRKLVKAGSVPEDVWRLYYLAQCNDAYWHGLFGGVYLAHLRQAIYENLLVAERTAEEIMGVFNGEDGFVTLFTDFDYDGKKEYLIETKKFNYYIKPDDGGTLFEHDVKIPGLEHNLQDTMTRYWEPYLEGTGFQPDWYRRVSLRIHLWNPYTKLWDWIRNTPFMDQSDLALAKYYIVPLNKRGIVMRTLGGHYVYGLEKAVIEAEKTVEILDTGIRTTYRLINHGKRTVDTLVGFEYHIAPKIDRSVERRPIVYIVEGTSFPADHIWEGKSREITIKSPVYPAVKLRSNNTSILWVSPLNSYARTEKGLMNIFQGFAVMFLEPLALNPGDSYEASIEESIMLQ